MYKILAKTLFTGQNLIFVPECQSTNTLIAEKTTKSALPEGTIVITAHQTAGRGQRGNAWLTDAGANLTFSLLLKPTFLQAKNQFNLTRAVSLSVLDLIIEIGASAKIKWPNDILFNNKKICGILIENTLHGETIQQSIVGIGLNINQKKFEYPSASSLSLICEKDFELNPVFNSIVEKLEKRYLQLRSGKTEELKEEYLQNLLGYKQRRKFIAEEKEFEGMIEGVTDSGELIIASQNNMLSFNLKEIAFIL
ncbi:MAG: biotin--[acetyl-CoA-carboxylase] ligase [Bacteroidetes bacterium]|nr:biotin--[acetyl-CoA-carboxylase] ligase [Bacteroidota bacterium]